MMQAGVADNKMEEETRLLQAIHAHEHRLAEVAKHQGVVEPQYIAAQGGGIRGWCSQASPNAQQLIEKAP
jgi:hypothetical protein